MTVDLNFLAGVFRLNRISISLYDRLRVDQQTFIEEVAEEMGGGEVNMDISSDIRDFR
jgi:hypothetical protein